MLHNDRYSRYRFGLLGEYAACLLLWSKGYRIVARRVRNFAGEIDIIARRGKLLIFIEVKARNCATQLAYAYTPRQSVSMTKAAEIYLQSHRQYDGFDIRFDLIYITPYRLPIHIEDAW